MAPRKNTERIEVYEVDGYTILDMGPIEIWDGADLSLIRDMLVQVIEKEGSKFVAVDMSFVKYVPSGFFGMLYDWFEKGIAIQLLSPQPNVREMLWFQRFFSEGETGVYDLHEGPEEAPISDIDFDEDEEVELLNDSDSQLRFAIPERLSSADLPMEEFEYSRAK